MSLQRPGLGIALMAVSMLIFAIQDGVSRHLAAEYNVMMVVMVRYWFFVAFVWALAVRAPGGLPGAAWTAQPVLQIGRGLLLAAEICVMVTAFTALGLVESHAVFACYPLLAAALSGPILGERVGVLRWTAITCGFVGVMIILKPGFGVFSIYAPFALCSAVMFALYSLLTRYASRQDSAMTSFFWTGTAGCVAMTVAGIWFWESMSMADWGLMAALCVSGVAGHWTLIRCYEVAEVGAVQPFAYLHLVFASAIGVTVFSEDLETNVFLGASIIVASGLFTLWRENRAKRL
ncbi:MAG: DMT family transporter [Rhodobacter sp.]|nr:DMT family transporter [Rhodobacter sp.]